MTKLDSSLLSLYFGFGMIDKRDHRAVEEGRSHVIQHPSGTRRHLTQWLRPSLVSSVS